MSSRFNMTESAQKGSVDMKVWKDRPVITDLLADNSDRKITRNQKGGTMRSTTFKKRNKSL